MGSQALHSAFAVVVLTLAYLAPGPTLVHAAVRPDDGKQRRTHAGTVAARNTFVFTPVLQ
jgi:hypothetical protein